MSETSLINIPAEKAYPKQGELPEHYNYPENYADKDEVTDEFLSQAASVFLHFDGQEQRERFCGVNGVMDQADRMERCSTNAKEAVDNRSGDQYAKSKTKIANATIFRAMRRLYTSINQYFGLDEPDQLPAEYEPEATGFPDWIHDSKPIATQQQALSYHTWSQDDRTNKVKMMNWSLVKYGNALVSDEWDKLQEVTDVRTVTELDPDTGLPVDWKIEKDEIVTVKDCPGLHLVDMKDAWFDAQLESDQWQWLFIRRLRPLEYLIDQQRQGFLKNVEKITRDQFYKDENDRTDVKRQRAINNADNASPEPNGLVLTYECWGYVPINKSGKYDPNGIPRLHWATVAGELNSSALVLRLMETPHRRKKIPYKLLHLLRDDNSAYHDSLTPKAESYYNQMIANLREACDNLRLRNHTPFAITGTGLKTFKLAGDQWEKNKMLFLAPGSNISELRVDDITSFTLPFAAYLEDEIMKLMGVSKPVEGEIAFARTAATQAAQNFEQGTAIIDEMASYIGDQFYPWLWGWDSDLWRQYGDHKTIKILTHNNLEVEVNPVWLDGPLKVRVTAVTRFKNDRLRRQEENNLFQNVILPSAQLIGEEGMKRSIRWIMGRNKVEEADNILPLGGKRYADIVAQQELQQMLSGQWVEPEPDDDHVVHINVINSVLPRLKLTSAEDKQSYEQQRGLPAGFIDQVIATLEANIAIRQELMRSPVQGQQVQQQAQDGLVGEMLGDTIEGQEGATANA